MFKYTATRTLLSCKAQMESKHQGDWCAFLTNRDRCCCPFPANDTAGFCRELCRRMQYGCFYTQKHINNWQLTVTYHWTWLHNNINIFHTPRRVFYVNSLTLSLSLSLSLLHFNGHFSKWTWVSQFYWSYGWWKWWWQLELQDMQSSSQIITTNKPAFYKPDALPDAQPTVSNS